MKPNKQSILEDFIKLLKEKRNEYNEAKNAHEVESFYYHYCRGKLDMIDDIIGYFGSVLPDNIVNMDKLQQVRAKLEDMKAKYNLERENEDNPNHSDGCGMFYSGFFACLKEISSFLDTLEVKEIDLEKEISEYFVEHSDEFFSDKYKLIAKHFYELGIKATQKGEKL